MENQSKYERAKKRVAQIKGFYSHLIVYIVINIFIVIWSAVIFKEVGEPPFQWNMLGTPILWGIGLAVHGLSVFSRAWIFKPQWEERQIAKIMGAEEAQLRFLNEGKANWHNDAASRKEQAEKQVGRMKGFYIHALIYLVVNLLLIVIFMVDTAIEGGRILRLEAFALPLLWGIGLGIHALNVFGLKPLAGKDWEQRQIRKFMEEDQEEAKKFN